MTEDAKTYIEKAQEIEASLQSHQRQMFRIEHLTEFRKVTENLRSDLTKAENDQRKLEIGIIGDVKAGKSSFLNALLFGGEEYLPKAATPMTAALTKISYAPNPHAVIYFYSREDWNEHIQVLADLYDKELNTQYREYRDAMEKLQRAAQASGGYTAYSPIVIMSEHDFETKQFQTSAEKRGAKELVRNASADILQKLGQIDEIDGDVIHKLNEYVGANGRYTPIVNHVELFVDEEGLKDFVIVDTPGLNDPIVSRELKTKEYLRECDVVLILSPCDHFMDESVVNLIARRLPQDGIKQVRVIGSKFDTGILNEPVIDFKIARGRSLSSYKGSFARTLDKFAANAQRTAAYNSSALDVLQQHEPIFISSMAYAIYRKMKTNTPLNHDEQYTVDRYHKQFKDVVLDAGFFARLSGMKDVDRILKEIQENKAKTIAERNANVLPNAISNHVRVLQDIQSDVANEYEDSKNKNTDTAAKRADVQSIMRRSGAQFNHAFQMAAQECRKNYNQISPRMIDEMQRYQAMDVHDGETTNHTYDTHEGFLGLMRKTYSYSITHKVASVSAVLGNLRSYAAACDRIVQDEFQHMLDKQKLKSQLSEIVLSAYDTSERAISPDEILLPIDAAISSISIESAVTDTAKYEDEISVAFDKGIAQDKAIELLELMQQKMLGRIKNDIQDKVDADIAKAESLLDQSGRTLAGNTQKVLLDALDRIDQHRQSIEAYLQEYTNFQHELDTYISELNELRGSI